MNIQNLLDSQKFGHLSGCRNEDYSLILFFYNQPTKLHTLKCVLQQELIMTCYNLIDKLSYFVVVVVVVSYASN